MLLSEDCQNTVQEVFTMTNNEFYNFLSGCISKADLYSANVTAKISAFIANKRHEMNMTQKEFAEMMNVSQGMISKWESAQYNFTVESIAKIAEKLNISFDIDFIPENEYLNSENNYDCGTFQFREPADSEHLISSAA